MCGVAQAGSRQEMIARCVMSTTVSPVWWLPLSTLYSICLCTPTAYFLDSYVNVVIFSRKDPKYFSGRKLTSRPSFLLFYPLLPGLVARCRRQPTDRDEYRHGSAGGYAAPDTSDVPAAADSRADHRPSLRASSHQRAGQEVCRCARTREAEH